MILLIFLIIVPAFSKESNIVSDVGRIVNGQNATEGQFPWQVEFMFINEDMLYFDLCGGAIISEEWILTAAHCLTNIYQVVVYSGMINLDDANLTLTPSFEYIAHEDFDNITLQNNIGLIHLDPPLVFDDKRSAISLSSDEIEAGIEVIVSGYGHSKFDDLPYLTNSLQYTAVSTLDNSECELTYKDMVSPGTICAIGNDQINSPCIGDEGGPLVINADTEPVHIGIFSFVSEDGCSDQSFPGVYTRTSYYREWIKEKSGI